MPFWVPGHLIALVPTPTIYAVAAVARDEVASTDVSTADKVVISTEDINAVVGVTKDGGAGGVGAYAVSLDLVARRP